ncbi:hypothetical protein F5Y13DRAFT_203975 [Hypoxylon sp. FL1857]|nr:hypothetical protein F5Y13DRAFT_203975 [Hypoxylon sp. FL1857]
MDYYQNLRPSGTLPYPNLIQRYASSNQQAYFMEPANKADGADGEGPRRTVRHGYEQTLEAAVMQHYPKFGSLSHHYKINRPGKGSHEVIFYRRDRGTLDHGLGREDEDTFECAKYNILRHPRQHDSNNPDYASASPGPVTGMDRDMLNLANYPYMSNTVMSAPLLPRRVPKTESSSSEKNGIEGQFLIPKKEQPSAMTRVFQTTELCEKLLLLVGARWDDLGNLSRTCQMILFALNNVSTHVDLTKGNFLNLDYYPSEIDEANAKAKAEGTATEGEFMKPVSSTFLILSNIRGPYRGAEDGEEDTDGHGYPAPPKGRFFRRSPEHRLIDIYKFMKIVDIRGSRIRMLHFHSTPYLDMSVLNQCLEMLPNLEVLGVHNCELLHFGKTVELLNAVIAHNNRHENRFVRADFSPFYYYGPQRQDDGRKGEYGVIPSDMGTVDTRRAVVATLRTAVPLAVQNGIDWFTPGTGMRKFLDRLPFSLGSIRYILEALFNMNYYEQGSYESVESYHWKAVSPENFQARHDVMHRTLHNDLVLAVHGKAMDQDTLSATMTLRGEMRLVKCSYCRVKLPAYFYTQESANRRRGQIECCGCQLRVLLDHQVDNFYQEKRMAVQKLLSDDNITSLTTFVNAKRIPTEAEMADPAFPFWDMAVATKQDVLDYTDCGALLLDGRPSSTHPIELRRIWVWKEKLLRTMAYLKRRVVDGPRRVQAQMDRCQKGIEQLEYLYFSGGLNGSFAIKQNRNKVDSLKRFIEQERARCGKGQMSGHYGARMAADWDTEITRYRQLVQAQAEVGVVENQGPYNTLWDNAPTGFW